MELVVIRHTRIAASPGACYGRTEVPLAESFSMELKELREQLGPDLPPTVFSSPSERCARLAESLAPGRWRPDGRLKELFFGAWEGKNWNTIPEHESRYWMKDFVNIAPPGGETVQVFHRRVVSLLESLLATDKKSVLIISHAG
ncbi:MAG: histidine phosphatase family protein, partial [Opitutales bacterium]